MALPAEIDFDRDREGSPARMNRAMDFLWAQIRTAIALQPEFRTSIDEMQRFGLERMSAALTPIFLEAIQIGEGLRGIRDTWEGDLLPAEVAARAAATVAQQLAGYRHRWLGPSDGPPTHDDVGAPVTIGSGYYDTALGQMRVLGNAGWIDASSISADAITATNAAALATQKAAELAGAAGTATGAAATAVQMRDQVKLISDAINPARFMPVGGAAGQVLTKRSGADFAAGWDPLPSQNWREIATIPAAGQAATFANIPPDFTDLLIVIDNIRFYADVSLKIELSSDGSTFSSARPFTAAKKGPMYGNVLIPAYRRKIVTVFASADTDDNWTNTPYNSTANILSIATPAGVSAIRISYPSVNGASAGNYTLLAR